MSRDYKLFVEDILDSIEKIEQYTSGMSREEFGDDSKTFDAVLRNLEVIGEAVKNIPGEIKEIHSNIEWRKMAGIRDILIHEYFGVDKEIIWDVVERKLPPLKKQIRQILNK